MKLFVLRALFPREPGGKVETGPWVAFARLIWRRHGLPLILDPWATSRPGSSGILPGLPDGWRAHPKGKKRFPNRLPTSEAIYQTARFLI